MSLFNKKETHIDARGNEKKSGKPNKKIGSNSIVHSDLFDTIYVDCEEQQRRPLPVVLERYVENDNFSEKIEGKPRQNGFGSDKNEFLTRNENVTHKNDSSIDDDVENVCEKNSIRLSIADRNLADTRRGIEEEFKKNEQYKIRNRERLKQLVEVNKLFENVTGTKNEPLRRAIEHGSLRDNEFPGTPKIFNQSTKNAEYDKQLYCQVEEKTTFHEQAVNFCNTVDSYIQERELMKHKACDSRQLESKQIPMKQDKESHMIKSEASTNFSKNVDSYSGFNFKKPKKTDKFPGCPRTISSSNDRK